jgi:oxaloacetate decarboxylase beta subunit
MAQLMFGNLLRASGVVERLSKTAQNELINIVTILLASRSARNWRRGILRLVNRRDSGSWRDRVSLGTARGVSWQNHELFHERPINPLIGAAGVSAVPMAARGVNRVGQEADPGNILLMHAMGRMCRA